MINASLALFLEDAMNVAQLISVMFISGIINDIIPTSLSAGSDVVFRSRLIPEEVYRPRDVSVV